MPGTKSERASTLIAQVRGLARLMVDELTDRLHAAGYRDITAAQYVVFESLDPEGTRLTTLAERAGITRQSLTELVSALERNGYLQITADPDDRRARRVRATSRGRALARRAIEEIAALEAGWQESFRRAGGHADVRDLLRFAIDEHAELGTVDLSRSAQAVTSASYAAESPYYDAIYEAMKDYRAEAERLRHLLERYAKRPVHDLLDMACGTGLHDQYLKDHYHVEGADLSPPQLAIARRRCPDLVFHEADMTNFDLARDYDAVTCLFSAVAHVLTEENLCAAVRAMAAHVRPGGLVVIEPFIDPGEFRPGHISVEEGRDGDGRVVRVTYSERAGNVLKLTMHHYVSRGGKVSVVEPVHFDMAMFTADQLRGAMESAGLEVFHEPEGLMGRGLYIGRVPVSHR